MTLADLQQLFASAGCQKLYAKPLAENDNSKNQVYLGPGFEALNLFPNKGIFSDSSPKNSIFKAKLDFGWLLENGAVAVAPRTQLILYPQYPEVRMSGFLIGCSQRPSTLMNTRMSGRILFLGVAGERILGFVAAPKSSIAAEFRSRFFEPNIGVFTELSLPKILDAIAARNTLLAELRRIARRGWIDSKQLASDGSLGPCNAPQCGGLTLEAELGIPKNSKSEPDFHGWEVKQHSVSHFDRTQAGVITLMTPEPTGGFYKDKGVAAFVKEFGYADKRGRVDRLNFGGVHKVGIRHPLTGLTIVLAGYDDRKGQIVNSDGSLNLVNDCGTITASWNFAGLLSHWTRKHAKAVYVPSQTRISPQRQYCYGHRVRLAIGTDFLLFLKAVAAGNVYYDPGIKMERASSEPRIKRRSQFRVASKNIASLYETVELVQL